MIKNLFAAYPRVLDRETFDTLLETGDFKLERIISTGQSTPSGTWYEQDRDEWVVLLSGEAGIFFEGGGEALVLRPGDHLVIPAHTRHRVEWTAAGAETVWLALHFRR